MTPRNDATDEELARFWALRTRCDHGEHEVHRDRNGWWIGADGTSDCPDSDEGHEVDGSARA